VELDTSNLVDMLYYRADDRPSLRRAWSRKSHKFWLVSTISLERLKLQQSNFVHR